MVVLTEWLLPASNILTGRGSRPRFGSSQWRHDRHTLLCFRPLTQLFLLAFVYFSKWTADHQLIARWLKNSACCIRWNQTRATTMYRDGSKARASLSVDTGVAIVTRATFSRVALRHTVDHSHRNLTPSSKHGKNFGHFCRRRLNEEDFAAVWPNLVGQKLAKVGEKKLPKKLPKFNFTRPMYFLNPRYIIEEVIRGLIYDQVLENYKKILNRSFRDKYTSITVSFKWYDLISNTSKHPTNLA